jgi:hypothetical protein
MFYGIVEKRFFLDHAVTERFTDMRSHLKLMIQHRLIRRKGQVMCREAALCKDQRPCPEQFSLAPIDRNALG